MSFQPFPQRCVTCGVQFRVTKAELIGQIVGCPKCGSMLQIVAPESSGMVGNMPPQAPMAVGEELVDSEAMTQASSIVSEPGDWSSIGLGDVSTDNGSSGRFEIDDTIPQDGDAGETSSPLAGSSTSRAPDPVVDFESERTARQRQIVLVAFTLLSGLCIAVLLFVMFVRSWRNRPVAGDSTAGVDLAVVDPDAPNPASLIPELDAEPPTTPPIPPTSNDDVIGTGTAGDAFANDTEVATTDSLSDLITQPLGPAGLPAPITDESAATSEPNAPVADMSDGTAADDPEDVLPNEIPPEFSAAFSPFLVDLAAASPDAPPTLNDSVFNEPVQLDQAAALDLDPMMVANPPEKIEYRRCMAVDFRVSADKGYPFSDFALLISQLTTVPIEIDWLSFDLAGIDVRQTLLLDKEKRSADGHLTIAMQQIKAVSQLDDTVLRITVADEIFAAARDRVRLTDDFAESKQSADLVLAEFLSDGVAAVDASEKEEADDEEADNDPDAETRLRTRSIDRLAMMATEALRRMRNVAPRIDDEVIKRWVVPLKRESPPGGVPERAPGGVPERAPGGVPVGVWRVVRDGESGPQAIEAVPMAQWVRDLSRRNDATCLVHWTDATQRMMSPAQLVLPHSGDGFDAMVTSTLEPFGVQIREVSPGYWWMGTAGRYDRLPVIVWTDPMTASERQSFLRKLNMAIGGLSRDYFRVAHDPASDRLLMLLPRFVMTQIDKFR